MAGSLTEVKSTWREPKSCASTWPEVSQHKQDYEWQAKLTKKQPVKVGGPPMALQQEQLQQVDQTHSLPPSQPPPPSAPWTQPAPPPRWELLRRTCGWALVTSLLNKHSFQSKLSQVMKKRGAEQAPEEDGKILRHLFNATAILPPLAGRCRTWPHPQASLPQGRRQGGSSWVRLRRSSKLANRRPSSWQGTWLQTVHNVYIVQYDSPVSKILGVFFWNLK